MTDIALFDMQSEIPEPARDDTPEKRRRARQLARIRNGYHPLGGTLKLHDQADRDAVPYEGRDLPYRCGTCAFRVLVGGHARDFPKCAKGDGIRVTNGPASDVKAWWPACRDYEEVAA